MANLKAIFFKELELHGKLKFQKSGKLLNILQTVVFY